MRCRGWRGGVVGERKMRIGGLGGGKLGGGTGALLALGRGKVKERIVSYRFFH